MLAHLLCHRVLVSCVSIRKGGSCALRGPGLSRVSVGGYIYLDGTSPEHGLVCFLLNAVQDLGIQKSYNFTTLYLAIIGSVGPLSLGTPFCTTASVYFLSVNLRLELITIHAFSQATSSGGQLAQVFSLSLSLSPCPSPRTQQDSFHFAALGSSIEEFSRPASSTLITLCA